MGSRDFTCAIRWAAEVEVACARTDGGTAREVRWPGVEVGLARFEREEASSGIRKRTLRLGESDGSAGRPAGEAGAEKSARKDDERTGVVTMVRIGTMEVELGVAGLDREGTGCGGSVPAFDSS